MPRPPRSFFLLLVVLAGAAAWFLGLWNDFPYFYHTDEPGKARQVIEGTRNLHHPLLMLESAAILAKATGVPMEPQAVTETGRHLSAWFCALAAVLLAATMARVLAWPVALLAGVLLVLQPDVQEYARFFKEDPSLMFGWACVFAAMAWMEKSRGPAAAAALGIAVAMAASGKYVGIVMLVPAALILGRAIWQDKYCPIPGTSPCPAWKLVVPMAAAMLLTIGVINLRLFLDPETFRASLTKETTLVLEGQGTVSKSLPHGGFFERLFNRSSHLMPFVVIGWFAAIQQRRTLGWTLLMLVFSPWALATLLAFSAKDSGRYFMPASLGLAASAAIGAATVAGWMGNPRTRRLAMTAAAVALVAASLIRSRGLIQGFHSDARKEMLAWISRNVPPGSKILQGRKVCLPDSEGTYAEAWKSRLPGTLELKTVNLISEQATDPAGLAAAGFTHVAMAGDEYEVYLKNYRAKEGKAEERQRRQTFYQALFREGTVIWERPSGKVGTHQPPLKLLRLPAPADPRIPATPPR